MSTTKIEWATTVWNPVTGCEKVSPGCANCYAERFAKRLQANPKIKGKYKEGFKVTFHPEELYKPFSWRIQQRCFTVSMGDLFHPEVKEEWIDQIMAVIAFNQKHNFLILTKRPERMLAYFNRPKDFLVEKWENAMAEEIDYKYADGSIYSFCLEHWPLTNLWLGVTAENQEQADKRIPILLSIPAKVRLISCEPLLGGINIRPYLWEVDLLDVVTTAEEYNISLWEAAERLYSIKPEVFYPSNKINWVIAGGETGPKARPIHPDWVRSLRDQCKAAKVPFFFKSWGEWIDNQNSNAFDIPLTKFLNSKKHTFGSGWTSTDVNRLGKQFTGRILDGVEYNEFPKP